MWFFFGGGLFKNRGPGGDTEEPVNSLLNLFYTAKYGITESA